MKHLMLIFLLMLCGCTPEEDQSTPQPPTEIPGAGGSSQPPMNRDLEIIIEGKVFSATFADNAAAATFKDMLPLTLNMSDLNNNEKYTTLSKSIPTASTSPGTIYNGDIMLFGSSTLVLFYKSFSTSYSYTRIGQIDDPSGLHSALGESSVRVKFE